MAQNPLRREMKMNKTALNLVLFVSSVLSVVSTSHATTAKEA